MLAPSANPGRFGAWSAGPLTGTVTKPPPSAGPASPPSATAGGYIPQPGMAMPSGGSGGDYGNGASIDPFSGGGPNPEWGGGRQDKATGIPMGGDTPSGGDKAMGMVAGAGPGTGGNGSEYGMGGAGLDGGGGSGPMHGGVMALDDGGEVPEDTDGDNDGDAAPTDDTNGAMPPGGQQAQNTAVDPMMIIKNALDFGRQQMGMPKNFSSGGTGNSDGPPMSDNIEDRRGMLDANGNGIPGGAAPTMKAPGVFDAAMKKVRGFADGGEVPMPGDDQQQGTGGGLPDPRKTMAYLAGAGGVQPDIADALERHVDPQGTMDPAERALKAITTAPTPESQFGLLQHYRTRANAYSGAAHAALDQGNMAQAAQHATSVFNNTPTGYKVQFVPARGGLAVQASKIGQQSQPQQGFSEGGAVDTDNPTVMMKSYDDGGEVPSEDDDGEDGGAGDAGLDQGMIPAQDDNTSSVSTPAAEPEAPMQPVVLNPDQVKKVVAPGAVDTANDHPKGFMGWLTDILGKATSPGAPAAPGMPATQGGQALQNAGGVGGLIRNGVKSLMSSGTQPDVQAALDADGKKDAPQAPQQGAPQAPQQGAPQGIPSQPQQQTGAGRGTPSPTPGFSGVDKSVQAPQSPEDAMLARFQKQADAIFGRAANGTTVNDAQTRAQKQQYIEKAMQAAQGNAAKLEQTNAAWGGRSGIATDNRNATNERASNAESGKNARSANSLAEKLAQTQITVAGRAANTQQTNLVRMIGQQISANPTQASDPQTILKQIQPFAAQLKQQGVTPQDILQNLQRAQQGGQTGQTGQQPQPGERKQFKQGWGVWDGTAWKPE